MQLIEWLIGLGIQTIIMVIVIIIIVQLLIQAFFLGIGLGFVNGKNRDLSTTFVTSLLMSLVIWIPCLGCILAWYFIKSRHNVGWVSALIAWILGAIVAIIVTVVLVIGIFGMTILSGLIPGFP